MVLDEPTYEGSHSESMPRGHKVVGFEVIPLSIKHQYGNNPPENDKHPRDEVDGEDSRDDHVHRDRRLLLSSHAIVRGYPLTTCNTINGPGHSINPERWQEIDGAHVTDGSGEVSYEEVIYTYDVRWERSSVHWTNRWDVYLTANSDNQAHYFSIINSLMIVIFLSWAVAMILVKALRKDIIDYHAKKNHSSSSYGVGVGGVRAISLTSNNNDTSRGSLSHRLEIYLGALGSLVTLAM